MKPKREKKTFYPFFALVAALCRLYGMAPDTAYQVTWAWKYREPAGAKHTEWQIEAYINRVTNLPAMPPDFKDEMVACWKAVYFPKQ